MVEAGEIQHGILLVAVAVEGAAVAVVDEVPEPALVGILQHRLIVHQQAEIDKILTGDAVICHEAHGLHFLISGGVDDVGERLFTHGKILLGDILYG